MTLPQGITGSLYPTFVPDRLVSLSVKPAYAITLYVRLPSVLSRPLEASDTILEATTPVKLPAMQCLLIYRIRIQINKEWYFTNDSTLTSVKAS